MTTGAPIQKFSIIGAGAFGTALADMLCRAGRSTVLWARNSAISDEINTRHTNETYLTGVLLAPNLVATSTLGEAATADVILLASPAQATRSIARQLALLLKPGTPVVICAKGFERASGASLTSVLRDETPHATPAVLSGPSFAADMVKGLPTALTLACANEHLGATLATAIGHRNVRLYWTSDMTGVEIGGAVKNVLAIAAGIVHGKQLGASAHAAVVTRGFAELRRFGAAMGARPETLNGLSGLGDLILTCSSPQSRNMSLGIALGQGANLQDILSSRRSVFEGVWTSTAVSHLAREKNVAMPISEAIAAIVTGEQTIDDAIGELLSRPFKAED